MYRSLILPLSCIAILNPPFHAVAALSLRHLTLTRISHGYLRKTFCDFGIQFGAGSGCEHGDDSLKPWLSNHQATSRSMTIDYNVQACQCDGITLECARYGMESGSILSICFWTPSDAVDLVGVSEMTMTQDDQLVQLISNGETNEFTTSEASNGTTVVHTLVFPDQENAQSDVVVVDGTVFFAPKENHRELLVPEDGSYFRVEVPVLRHIPSKKKLRDALIEYLQKPDFAISFGVIIFLWVGLCIIFSNGCHRNQTKKSEDDSTTDTDDEEEDSQASSDELDQNQDRRDLFPTV